MVGIGPQLRGQQGQSFVEPCGGERTRFVRTDGEFGHVGGASVPAALPAPAVSTGMASFMGQGGEEGKSARRRLIINLCAHPSLSEKRQIFFLWRAEREETQSVITTIHHVL